MKITVLDGFTTNPGDISWKPFENLGKLMVFDFTAQDEIFSRCAESEIIISNKTVFSGEILKRLENVKYIGLLSTGYNVVDLEAAESMGITVTNVPAYSSDAVAQHTIALLLELMSRVGEHSAAVHEGKWSDKRRFCFWNRPLTELSGKTMGIIGYGSIGRRVAAIANALGMKVIFTARHEVCDTTDRQAELDELFRTSDVVTLHCPLNPQSENIICAENLNKMKPNAVVINTSRGGAVDESALAAALNSGKISGAAIDVMSTEPPLPDNPLLTAKNCVITPHIAWAAAETRQRLVDIAAGNLEAFISGNPRNVVSGGGR